MCVSRQSSVERQVCAHGTHSTLMKSGKAKIPWNSSSDGDDGRTEKNIALTDGAALLKWKYFACIVVNPEIPTPEA